MRSQKKKKILFIHLKDSLIHCIEKYGDMFFFHSKQPVYFYSSLHDITCVGVVEVIGEGKEVTQPQVVNIHVDLLAD